LCFLLGCMVYKYTDFGNLTTLTKEKKNEGRNLKEIKSTLNQF
jgi:hypothetical protein